MSLAVGLMSLQSSKMGISGKTVAVVCRGDICDGTKCLEVNSRDLANAAAYRHCISATGTRACAGTLFPQHHTSTCRSSGAVTIYKRSGLHPATQCVFGVYSSDVSEQVPSFPQ